MPNVLQKSKNRRDVFICGSMLRGSIEEIKKQAEQRTNSRFIVYVPANHNSALNNTQWVDVMETLQNHKKTRRR